MEIFGLKTEEVAHVVVSETMRGNGHGRLADFGERERERVKREMIVEGEERIVYAMWIMRASITRTCFTS